MGEDLLFQIEIVGAAYEKNVLLLGAGREIGSPTATKDPTAVKDVRGDHHAYVSLLLGVLHDHAKKEGIGFGSIASRWEENGDILSLQELAVGMVDPPPAEEGQDHGGVGDQQGEGEGDHEEGGRQNEDRAGLNGGENGKEDEKGNTNEGDLADGVKDPLVDSKYGGPLQCLPKIPRVALLGEKPLILCPSLKRRLILARLLALFVTVKLLKLGFEHHILSLQALIFLLQIPKLLRSLGHSSPTFPQLVPINYIIADSHRKNNYKNK